MSLTRASLNQLHVSRFCLFCVLLRFKIGFHPPSLIVILIVITIPVSSHSCLSPRLPHLMSLPHTSAWFYLSLEPLSLDSFIFSTFLLNLPLYNPTCIYVYYLPANLSTCLSACILVSLNILSLPNHPGDGTSTTQITVVRKCEQRKKPLVCFWPSFIIYDRHIFRGSGRKTNDVQAGWKCLLNFSWITRMRHY